MNQGGPLRRRKALARGTSELKRSPLARGTSELKRTELKRDPTYRIPQRSAKRRAAEAARESARAEVLRRASYRCQYRILIPEVPCGWLPDRRGLEVDELRGGSWRHAEWLDPDQCRACCPVHHDWKTDHKRELLRRLRAYEGDLREQREANEAAARDRAPSPGPWVHRGPHPQQPPGAEEARLPHAPLRNDIERLARPAQPAQPDAPSDTPPRT